MLANILPGLAAGRTVGATETSHFALFLNCQAPLTIRRRAPRLMLTAAVLHKHT